MDHQLDHFYKQNKDVKLSKSKNDLMKSFLARSLSESSPSCSLDEQVTRMKIKEKYMDIAEDLLSKKRTRKMERIYN